MKREVLFGKKNIFITFRTSNKNRKVVNYKINEFQKFLSLKNKIQKNYNYKRKDNKEKVQQEDERNVIL